LAVLSKPNSRRRTHEQQLCAENEHQRDSRGLRKKWVKDEFLYIEDAIEAAIIKFIELRGVAEATDLKALADQLEADLTVYWSTKYRENIIAQLRAKLEEK
jgi:hypothetical protein